MEFNQIPVEVYLSYILPYIIKKPMKLLDWINIKKLYWDSLSCNPNAIDLITDQLKVNPDVIDLIINWNNLSRNPNAIELLKQNPDKIDWFELSGNNSPGAIELLITYGINPDKIDWFQLSLNPSAIELLKQNPDKIDWFELSANNSPGAIELITEQLKVNKSKINKVLDWSRLSGNPSAIKLLKANPDKINWRWLSDNTNPEAIELLKQNPDKINWYGLSYNKSPEAIELLKQNPDKINWDSLSGNESPEAIELLKQNPDKIVWDSLSENPGAIGLITEQLKANQSNINNILSVLDWTMLSINPSIFEIDYKKWDKLMLEYYERFIYKN